MNFISGDEFTDLVRGSWYTVIPFRKRFGSDKIPEKGEEKCNQRKATASVWLKKAGKEKKKKSDAGTAIAIFAARGI